MFILDDRHRTIKSEESNKNPKQTIKKKNNNKKTKNQKKNPKIEFIIIIMKAAYCKSNA